VAAKFLHAKENFLFSILVSDFSIFFYLKWTTYKTLCVFCFVSKANNTVLVDLANILFCLLAATACMIQNSKEQK
jgi:hypothetical protein